MQSFLFISLVVKTAVSEEGEVKYREAATSDPSKVNPDDVVAGVGGRRRNKFLFEWMANKFEYANMIIKV